MPPPVYSVTDYFGQFQRLLPRGRVWHRGWGWIQDADLLALMPTWSRLHVRLNDLITEIFPCTTTELLPEWEATLGLPDCLPLETIQQRTAAVCAKFSMRGGQSMDYFIALAAAYGFGIEITQHSAFRVDYNSAEDLLNDAAWDFAFTVTSTTETIIYFSADLSFAEEPLAWWGNQQLECLIQKYAPAHTIPIFQYVDPTAIWDAGAAIWDTDTTVAVWDGLGAA